MVRVKALALGKIGVVSSCCVDLGNIQLYACALYIPGISKSNDLLKNVLKVDVLLLRAS